MNNPANIPLNHQSRSAEHSASIPAAAVLSDECSFSKCSFLCVSSRLGDSDRTFGWCKSWRELWFPRNVQLDWQHRGFDLQPSNMFSLIHPSKIHFAAFVLFHCHVDFLTCENGRFFHKCCGGNAATLLCKSKCAYDEQQLFGDLQIRRYVRWNAEVSNVTHRELRERRPWKASEANSDIWLLLKSL